MKMRTLIVAAAVAALAVGAAHAAAPILDFEDLYPGYEADGTIADGYHGFNWDNAGWLTKGYSRLVTGKDSGYENSIVGKVGMVTQWAYAVTLDDGYFDFTCARVGAGWNDGQYVTFEGWRDASKLYSQYQTASYYGEWASFDFYGIDTLKILPDLSTGTDHSGGDGGMGHHIMVDEINTPELPPSALLGLSMLPLGLAYLRGRRRKES